MSYHRSTHSLGKVPFLWEYQPGLCKVTPGTEESPKAGPPQKPLELPPPPYSAGGRKLSAHGLYVPLPPCPFQPTLVKSSPKKGQSRTEEDPFLAAYLECTRSVKKQSKATKGKAGLEKIGNLFSCKHAGGVREDGMVRLSQLPEIRLAKGKAGFEKIGNLFSCKHACGVREDGMVRLSQLPEIRLAKGKAGFENIGNLFSCKHACGVREDGMLRLSQLPEIRLAKGKAGFEKIGNLFSCKHACGVREDGMVRLSQLLEIRLKGKKFGSGHVWMPIDSPEDRGY